MSVELIFELAWKSVLFAGVTLLMLRLFRGRSSAERSWIANIGIASLMLLPLTLVAGPEWRVQPPESVAAVMPALEPSAIVARPSPLVDTTTRAAPNETSGSVGIDAFFWTYAIPAGLLVLLLLVSLLRLHLLRRRAEVLVEPQWSMALFAAQRRMNFRHGTALLVSEELQSPISWGVVRPVILLDRRAASDSSQAEAIIAHELAHVVRLDWAMLVAGRLATALYWFNPLVWMLVRGAHELAEQAVDDTVLNSDIPNADYAQLLINAACHDNRSVVLAANGVTGCGTLTQRVERVLDSSVSRRAARGGWVLGCCAVMICIAGPVAALSSQRPAPLRAAADDKGSSIVINGRSIEVRGESADTSNVPARNLAPTLAPAKERSPALEQALVSAVSMGDVAAMNQLIAQGVSVNASVDGDGSPLIVAARQGRRDLIDALLAKGAHVDMGVEGDGNPLIAAAAAGRLDLVQNLLDHGANIEALVPGDENALMQASRHGHESVVRLLIARGADVNSRVGTRTPLVMAEMGGHANIAAVLRGAGATQ